MAKKQQKSRWGVIIGILLFLFLLAYVFSGILSILIGGDDIKDGNVALIPIKGVISTQDKADIFDSGVASSGQIVKDIEKAAKNPEIQAIIFEIDSPGGTPVATDEIATAVERANKTAVAWIREVGASGAYWVASAAEHVVANRMSITGSIGVFGSYLEFSGLLDDWNVSYERLVAGKYKDTGVPLRKLSPQEKRMLQRKLDLMHQVFKDEVQKNRGLTNSQIEAVSQGEFYLGNEAINIGLVDELGGKKEAVDYIEKKLNISAEITVYEHKVSFLETLAGLLNEKSFFLGRGIGDSLSNNARVGMLT
ncbi:MAG: signal peptide peptidase SppA [Nanoarchaeota archaeon]|nr:signal peptide peptidase SppA [Nanoarchaeota archaeon]